MSRSSDSRLGRFFDSILYSYAQILFSNRRWFGAVICAATFLHPASGALGLAGVIISNLMAHGLKFDAVRIRSGFYGFNGILFGAAYGYYFAPSPLLLALFPVFIAISFMVAAALENYLAAAFNLPGLSLPFVIALYISILFLKNYGLFPQAPETVLADVLTVLPRGVQHYFQSWALIFLQPNALAGVLIAAGLVLFSRVLLVLSVVAYAVSALFVHLLLPGQTEMFGLVAGLNAMLVAIALGGSLVIPSRKSLMLALVGVLITVVFTGVFAQVSAVARLPLVVLPFNFVVLGTLYSLKFRQKSSELVLLYFAPGSPEENFYYHHAAQERFGHLAFAQADLPVSGPWRISQGHAGDVTHKDEWKHAWDFVVAGEDDRTFQNGGTALEDFHCYRLPLLAPLDGTVSLVVDSIPNNDIGKVNLEQNWGNTVILEHADGLFSCLSHLDTGSAKVSVGSRVRRGDIVGLCGNSGRSPEPHLHFQFQPTDRLGERTLRHPFGSYLEKSGDDWRLRVSGIPTAGSSVQSLVPHRGLRSAFAFPLESKYRFETRTDSGRTSEEEWKVKAGAYGQLYLESSAGAWLDFFVNDRIYYATAFRGSKASALYSFYLCAPKVPLGFHDDMVWDDALPLSTVFRSPAVSLSEFMLLAGRQLQARAELRFHESVDGGSLMNLSAGIAVSGRGVFRRIARSLRGEVRISTSGGIESFETFDGNRRLLCAKRIAGR